MAAESWKLRRKSDIDIIRKNCTLTAAEIAAIIKEQTGMDVSKEGVQYHLQRIREEAEKATIASSAKVDEKIEEFIDINTRDYLQFLDENIRRLAKIMRGEDDSFKCERKDGTPSTNYYLRTSDMLGCQIERAFKIRPDVATLNLNVKDETDIEEKMRKYEELYKN